MEEVISLLEKAKAELISKASTNEWKTTQNVSDAIDYIGHALYALGVIEED